jgi:hypothetical protein
MSMSVVSVLVLDDPRPHDFAGDSPAERSSSPRPGRGEWDAKTL